ncbi:MAG: hypothetical protein GF364_19360, partial [Candidatus Lokiarchaeota archaeon]|nr:hypothetical protein [Candidatus Lokiarchaeota archaeon]
MTDIVVARVLNTIYYILFVLYTIIVLIHILKNKDQARFKNSFKIFILTGIILSFMEVSGILIDLREYTVNGVINPPISILIGLIMGFGEGGA